MIQAEEEEYKKILIKKQSALKEISSIRTKSDFIPNKADNKSTAFIISIGGMTLTESPSSAAAKIWVPSRFQNYPVVYGREKSFPLYVLVSTVEDVAAAVAAWR